ILAMACGLLLLASSVTAQNAKARAELVGTWETTFKSGDRDIKMQMTFENDGKVTVKLLTDPPVGMDGKYTFVDDTTLEVESTYMGMTRKDKTAFKIAGDTLELNYGKGRVDIFKRVKK